MHRVNVPLALRTTIRTCLESGSGDGQPKLAFGGAHVEPAIAHAQRDGGLITWPPPPTQSILLRAARVDPGTEHRQSARGTGSEPRDGQR
jgi:hypothetical protein